MCTYIYIFIYTYIHVYIHTYDINTCVYLSCKFVTLIASPPHTQVGINTNPFSGSAHALCPFVGHRYSGYGSHSGVDGWRQFSRPKSLIFDPTKSPPFGKSLPPVARPSSKL